VQIDQPWQTGVLSKIDRLHACRDAVPHFDNAVAFDDDHGVLDESRPIPELTESQRPLVGRAAGRGSSRDGGREARDRQQNSG
jgi:hypothetical protein